MTPALSWSAVSFINEFNAWKAGRLDYSPVAEDGTKGLAWRGEVPADVFECASVDAATALKNYSSSAIGARAGFAAQAPPDTPGPPAGQVEPRGAAPGALCRH
jgi:putative transposase